VSNVLKCLFSLVNLYCPADNTFEDKQISIHLYLNCIISLWVLAYDLELVCRAAHTFKLTSIILTLSYTHTSCEDPVNIFKSAVNFSIIFCCYKQIC